MDDPLGQHFMHDGCMSTGFLAEVL